MTKDAKPLHSRSHSPAAPRTIGNAIGLIYCKACGRLLASKRSGPRPIADLPCTPVPVRPR